MPGPGSIVRTAAALPLGITRRAVRLALRAVPGAGDGHEPERRTEPEREPPAAAPPETEAEAAGRAVARERERVEEAAVTLDEEPAADAVEVDEVVAEFADAEAAETPGAELHVDDPWEGYRRMRASEITARLEGQPPEVLAAVELFESAHRKRAAVLNAVRSIRA